MEHEAKFQTDRIMLIKAQTQMEPVEDNARRQIQVNTIFNPS
jgi:hypothetical protein